MCHFIRNSVNKLQIWILKWHLEYKFQFWFGVRFLCYSIFTYFSKQAGTGPSRRHIQGSKIAKRLPSVKYSFTEVKNRKFFEFFFKNYILKKLDRVARRGSLARAPGALTSHNAEKLKGGPFEVFQHPFCRKTWKNWRKKFFFIFGKKSRNAEKNWKEEPFGIFQHPFCRKTSKKCRGTLWGKKIWKKKSEKKSRSAEKNWKGGLFGLAPTKNGGEQTNTTIWTQFDMKFNFLKKMTASSPLKNYCL